MASRLWALGLRFEVGGWSRCRSACSLGRPRAALSEHALSLSTNACVLFGPFPASQKKVVGRRSTLGCRILALVPQSGAKPSHRPSLSLSWSQQSRSDKQPRLSRRSFTSNKRERERESSTFRLPLETTQLASDLNLKRPCSLRLALALALARTRAGSRSASA